MLMRIEDQLSDPAPDTPLARVRNALQTGYDAPRIAAMVGCSAEYVRFVRDEWRGLSWLIPCGQPGRRSPGPDLEWYDRYSV
jgi:hypothetical protein